MVADTYGSRGDATPITDTQLRAMIRRHCGEFGDEVGQLVYQESSGPRGPARLLRRMNIQPADTVEAQIAAAADWIRKNGSHALFRLVAERQSVHSYSPKPLPLPNTQKEDREILERLIRSQREKQRASATQTPLPPAPPELPPQSPASHAPPYLGTSHSIPFYNPSPGAKSLRGRPENPISGRAPDLPSSHGPAQGYSAPPGYPWPWPPHLKPGPEPPPSNIPPHLLTWPYVDRRNGGERRKKNDRRHDVDVIYRNQRYGGDRRRKDRRRNRPPSG